MTTDNPSARLDVPRDHNERMRAARRVSHWYLGYSDWADMLVGAYMNPVDALEALRRDKQDADAR